MILPSIHSGINYNIFFFVLPHTLTHTQSGVVVFSSQMEGHAKPKWRLSYRFLPSRQPKACAPIKYISLCWPLGFPFWGPTFPSEPASNDFYFKTKKKKLTRLQEAELGSVGGVSTCNSTVYDLHDLPPFFETVGIIIKLTLNRVKKLNSTRRCNSTGRDVDWEPSSTRPL